MKQVKFKYRQAELCDSFSGKELIGADFSHLNLSGTDFSGCNLMDADFHGADLRNCNFKNAKLALSNFKVANLHGCNFDGADLVCCNMEGSQGLPYFQMCINFTDPEGHITYYPTLDIVAYGVRKLSLESFFTIIDYYPDKDIEFTIHILKQIESEYKTILNESL